MGAQAANALALLVTALHLVLQNLDLAGDTGAASIAEQVERMVERELLTREQADSVPVERIAAFFAGDLGRRVLAGQRVLREMPFTLALPAEVIYPEAVPGEQSGEDNKSRGIISGCPEIQGEPGDEPAKAALSVAGLKPGPRGGKGETVLVQGVVDLLVDEGDGFLLVDYKSDRIPAAQTGLAAARYRGQLNLYAMAVESILHRKVKERYVYFFHLNRAVPL